MFDCIQVYTTVLKLPTGERSCPDNISYSKRVENTIFAYITYRIRKTVSENRNVTRAFSDAVYGYLSMFLQKSAFISLE